MKNSQRGDLLKAQMNGGRFTGQSVRLPVLTSSRPNTPLPSFTSSGLCTSSPIHTAHKAHVQQNQRVGLPSSYTGDENSSSSSAFPSPPPSITHSVQLPHRRGLLHHLGKEKEEVDVEQEVPTTTREGERCAPDFLSCQQQSRLFFAAGSASSRRTFGYRYGGSSYFPDRDLKLRKDLATASEIAAAAALSPPPEEGKEDTKKDGDTPSTVTTEASRHSSLLSRSSDNRWLADNSHTLALLCAGKFTRAYIVISSLMSFYTRSESPRHLSVLRGRRGQCSYALMNYRECIEDCQACLQLWHEADEMEKKAAASVDDGLSMGTAGTTSGSNHNSYSCLGSSSAVTQSDIQTVQQAAMCKARAHVMREDYALAMQTYATALTTREDMQRSQDPYDRRSSDIPLRPATNGERCFSAQKRNSSSMSRINTSEAYSAPLPLTSEQRAVMEQEKRAVSHVRRFRECVSAERWGEAEQHLLAGALPLVSETPLRALQAIAYVETGQVDAAREMLLPYVPTIPYSFPEDIIANDGTSSSSDSAAISAHEERLLRSNIEAHFLLATVLLAKASAYSGRTYMNVAAVLVQRCLAITPNYGPAIAVGSYLVSLEECFVLIDDCIAQLDYDGAAEHVSRAVQLDPTNRKINAVLHLKAAEARAAQGMPLRVIESCSLCVQLDALCAKAYLVRSSAYEAVQKLVEAAADRAMAIQLNPSYETLLQEEAKEREARAQRERHQQRQEELHQKTFKFSRMYTSTSQENGYTAHQSPPLPRPPPASSGGGGQPAGMTFFTKRKGETLYDVLDVKPTASTEEIRQHFKRLTLRYHPDKVVGESAEVQKSSLELFKRVNEAHSILSDPVKRAAYDLTI